MALMPHYVEEDFTLCSWTLEIELFPGVHTEAAIADDLDDMMERWGLDAELCTRMVRDGAANAVLASDFMQVTNMSCIAHSLHLVLSGALACQGKIQNEFQDAAGQREASVINETEFAQASEQEQLDLINAVEDFLDRTFAARETAPKVAMA
ncbi:hypothetical protein P3T76_000137 [Phytophthora citrophthora]|uniref:HAT C-terminal dimerisation domain-containing protein n=1 Tax=Phytophthora citrophthora TaxID=4793 RepID=A0AAD9GZR2_9STRA|nr:hypothetical protein P3T76_000137 [Phytophthora citrophthora]